MNKKISFTLTLVSFFILTIVQLVIAAEVSKEFLKTVPLQSEELVVETINGKIQVTTWKKNDVKIEANIRVKAKNHEMAEEFLEKVEIDIEQDDDKLIIEPNYPKLKKGDHFLDWIIGSRKPEVTIDFHITSPKKVNVNLKSVNGSVDVEKIQGHTKLKSVNGKIKAKEILGSVDAKTTNGAISVELTETDNENEMVFKSVNGSIQVYLPEGTKGDVEISTVNGSIHTDFPLSIQGKWHSKNVKGKLNGGGQEMAFSTVNGSISLYKKE